MAASLSLVLTTVCAVASDTMSVGAKPNRSATKHTVLEFTVGLPLRKAVFPGKTSNMKGSQVGGDRSLGSGPVSSVRPPDAMVRYRDPEDIMGLDIMVLDLALR